MKHILLIGLLVSKGVWGVELYNVLVGGDKQANVLFEVRSAKGENPKMRVQDNLVELQFAKTQLASDFDGELELIAPHTLIQKIHLIALGDVGVQAQIVLNGSIEKLKDRIHFEKVDQGFRLKVDFPTGASPVLGLLKEEQIPLASVQASPKPEAGSSHWIKLAIVCLVLLIAGLVTLLFVKLFKKSQAKTGERKYLIEQLSHQTMGPKMGVSLFKIGTEFLLVGITPNQISLISKLDKLSETYSSESALERDEFKNVVEEEMDKISSRSFKKNLLQAFSA